MNKLKLFGAFEKVEELEDGTLKVAGIASSEAVDADGETILADAMKEALPDYMKFGAVREMHSSWAAGTALKAEVADDNKTYFEALIVDSEAVKKVLAGVYKGFSIGGRIIERAGSIIKRLQLIEVSLVDRPANPEAVFSFGKVDGCEEGEEAQEAPPAPEQPEQPEPEEPEEEAPEQGEPEPEPEEEAPQAFTPKSREALARARQMVREAVAILEAFGFDQEETPETAPDETGKALMAKAATLENDLTKAAKDRDEAIAKAAALEARVRELEAMPGPAKAATMAVNKSDDRATTEREESLRKQAETIAALPPEERATALIKLINSGGTTR